MRQVRLVLGTLVVGTLLCFTPLSSAQTTLKYTTINVGLGDVWAPGIAGSAATTCSGENADNNGNHNDRGQSQRDQRGQHQEEGQVECDDNGAGSPPAATGPTQVVGYYNPPSAVSYLWNGTLTPQVIGYPGAVVTEASGINSAGHVSGTYMGSGGLHAFLMMGAGVNKQLDFPGAAITFGTGINATDQVVGYYFDATGVHGYVYSTGTFTPINYPSALYTYTFAAGINNLGQIVGYACTDLMMVACQAWLRTGTSSIPAQVTVTGALQAKAYGINTSGEIVGEYSDGTRRHGFRLASGHLTVVDIPSPITSAMTAVHGINDRGEITGEYKEIQVLGSPPTRQLGFKSP